MGVKGKRFLATRLGDPEGRCAFSGSLDQALTPQTRHLAGHELGDREEAASTWGPQGGLGVPIHEQYNQLSAKGASPPRGCEQPQGPGAWPTHRRPACCCPLPGASQLEGQGSSGGRVPAPTLCQTCVSPGQGRLSCPPASQAAAGGQARGALGAARGPQVLFRLLPPSLCWWPNAPRDFTKCPATPGGSRRRAGEAWVSAPPSMAVEGAASGVAEQAPRPRPPPQGHFAGWFGDPAGCRTQVDNQKIKPY